MTTPTFTTPPDAPSRAEPSTFSAKADAFVPYFTTLQGELVTGTAWFNSTASTVALNAATASGASSSALSVAGASAWVSAASYDQYDAVFSTVDYQTYRAKTTHTGETTDPSSDTINWAIVSPAAGAALGDYLQTERDPTADGFVLADGTAYLQSAYPALYAELGLLGDFNVQVADPATMPGNPTQDTAFSSDETYMAVAHSVSPYITIYKQVGGVFTKLADPATLPGGNGDKLAWSSDDTYLAVSHTNPPYLTIYKRSGDTFTKLADPTGLVAGRSYGLAFSPDDTHLAVSHQASPIIAVYKRTGDTFAKIADLPSLPTNVAYDLRYSPDGTYLACAVGVSPYVLIYKRAGDVYTKLADPVGIAAGAHYGLDFNADGSVLVVTHLSGAGGYFTVFTRVGDVFTKVNVGLRLPSAGLSCRYSADGNYIFMGFSATPYVHIYKVSGTSLTKLENVCGDEASVVNGGSFSPLGTYLALAASTSTLSIYEQKSYDIATEFVVPVNVPNYIKAE